ncbi:MAG: hypothetical protein IV100_22215 [Myxococcales bacterium]|nr:hypothetical protein [Myxococcales bacterium]
MAGLGRGTALALGLACSDGTAGVTADVGVVVDSGPIPDVPVPLSPCEPRFERDGRRVRVSGNAAYLKRLRDEGDNVAVWTPIRGARLTLAAGLDPLAFTVTTDEGCWVLEADTDEPDSELALILDADGPAGESGGALPFAVEVAPDDTAPPWSLRFPATEGRLGVDELYAAGAFNVLEQVHRAAARLEGRAPTRTPPPGLRVLWGPAQRPVCGSCFYVARFVLELTGEEGDVDAHDDAVVLHELGHYIEAIYGVYSNPGGFHDLEPAAPTMAWSEGFATWFQAIVRNDARYVDAQPARVYVLDLETPPEETRGTVPEGDASGLVSEAVIYALLWDGVDAPAIDDDTASWPVGEALDAALSPHGAGGNPRGGEDIGPVGADLNDWLRVFACPRAAGDIEAAALALGFPWSLDACPR